MKMMRMIIFSMALMIFSYGTFSESIFAESIMIQDESDLFKVSLIQIEKADINCGCNNKYIFQTYDKSTGQYGSVTLQNLTSKIIEIKLVNRTMIVFGKVGSSFADGITIFDLATQKEKDFILCYRPNSIFGNKYLVFEKFYPRFSPDEVRSSVLLIYDLEESPENNRLVNQRISADSEIKTGTPDYMLYSTNAGIPVFPLENLKMKNYNVWIDKPEKRNRIISPKCAWAEKSMELMLINYTGENNWVVVINLEEGIKKAKLRSFPINTPKIYNLDEKSKDYLERLRSEKKKPLKIKDIKVENDGTMKIELPKIQKYKKVEITFDLSKLSDK